MNEISNGCIGDDAIQQYIKYKNKHGIENIRKSIVMGSYGLYVARQASRIYNEIKFDFSNQKHIMDYFNDIITVEDVSNIEISNGDCEECYIDFYRMQVVS
jgi:hypothetical protein